MGFSHYTSQLTRARAEIVDMKKAVKDYHPLEGRGLTRDPMNKDVGVYSASGVYGDASLATLEKGRSAVEARIRYIVDELRGFILE